MVKKTFDPQISMDIPDFMNLAIDVPRNTLGIPMIDIPMTSLGARYRVMDTPDNQRRAGSSHADVTTRRSSQLSRNVINVPNAHAVESSSDDWPSSSLRGGNLTRKQSRSPTRSSNTRTSRHSGVGSRHDPYTIVSGPSTSSASALHGLRRKKSSASASTSTAVTARTSLDDIELEHAARNADIHHNDMILAASGSRQFEAAAKALRSLDQRSLAVQESLVTLDHTRRLDKGKMVELPHTPHLHPGFRRSFIVDTVDEARKAKNERPDRYSYAGPLAHAEFERMRKEIENLKKSVHDSKKTAKKQAKVRQVRLIHLYSLYLHFHRKSKN
jgi:hypothetical protein